MTITNSQARRDLVKRLLDAENINFDEALLLLEMDVKVEYVPSTFTYPSWYYNTSPFTAGITYTGTQSSGTINFNPENPT